jgi:hypothetical protein
MVLVYFLVFARTGAMLMLLPPIGEAGVPSRVRLALALAISFAIAPRCAHPIPQEMPQSVMAFGLMLAQEITAGVLVGAHGPHHHECAVGRGIAHRDADRAFLRAVARTRRWASRPRSWEISFRCWAPF